MALPPGTTLGPYKVLASLGAGGMGEVYRARDTRLGRDVAIKVLPQHLAATPRTRARFEREARTIARLNHPHICTLFDVGHQEGTDYLVMELLEGETLAHRLEEGPLPVPELLELGAQLAEALDRAHRAGVVHRDLKPGNVMLTKHGAKLMDFGLARAQAAAPITGVQTQVSTVDQPLTAEETIVGTFQYMAPEQLEGKEADARSDIWALGCVLYEMATGARAFKGESQASLIAAIMKEEPAAITVLRPVTPPALERVVRRCLQKDPDSRFQDSGDLAFDLESLSSVSQPAPDPARAGRRAPGMTTRLAWSLAGAALLAGITLVLGHVLWRPKAPAKPTFQRLTFRRGTIDNARFTPDGKTVVYDARWDGAPSEVFTLRPGSSESRALGIGNARLLGVSSRDEIAVQLRPTLIGGHSAGTMARVPLEGGVPREVRERVYEADWTSDGSQLAIAPSDSISWYIQLPTGRTIARSLNDLSFVRTAPVGEGVVFWRTAIAGMGGELVLARPGTPDRVLAPIGISCTGLAWNPRTRELWYSETDSVGSTILRAVSPSGLRRDLLSFAGGAALQDIRRDGGVLLSIPTSRRAIQALVPGETVERDLSWLDDSRPWAFSPDGRMLALDVRGVAGGRAGSVYIRPTDGSPPTRLGEGIAPDLSPDGKWVAAWLRGDRPRLRVMPVGAGEARDVPTGDVVPNSGVWYFPDGHHLLIYGRRGGEMDQLLALPLEGGIPRPVTPPGWTFWEGQRPLSPDGRRVACVDADDVNHIVPVEGGPPRPLPGVERGEVVLGWSDDSRSLYVFRRGDLPARVFRVDLATGRRHLWKVLGPADRAGVSLVNFAVIAADGRQYAYTFARSLTDLFLVSGLK